ncbi:MAG: hypothetical protein Q8R96_08530 [Bacteroidota bacterium]|nr:hypothetical protein [Bacteroidota bacterium]
MNTSKCLLVFISVIFHFQNIQYHLAGYNYSDHFPILIEFALTRGIENIQESLEANPEDEEEAEEKIKKAR